MTTSEHASSDMDALDGRRALRAPSPLQAFDAAGVLAAADVHVACRLAALGGDDDPDVLLAAALAVRAPRLGHVCTDLATIGMTAAGNEDAPIDVSALPWPEADRWIERLAASPLVGGGDGGPPDRPLRLVGSLLYLDRYWRQERSIAADLIRRAAEPAGGVNTAVLTAGLDRLFGGEESDLQRLASEVAVRRRFSVIAGGPGTGKTTTVARLLVLLDEQASAAGVRPPRVALAAPTGKAAARLEQAVHSEAAALALPDDVRSRLLATTGSTLHRLLGWRPGTRSRFRHDHHDPLPHDVVVVDETSMVSQSLMARLVDAVRPDARLVLVGDPDQLASVEAGAVLGDIAGPAAAPPGRTPPPPDGERVSTGRSETGRGTGHSIGDGIVVLRRVHRFGGAIAELALAVQAGDDDAAVDVLRRGDNVTWIDHDAAEAVDPVLAPVRHAVVDGGRAVVEAARSGDGHRALEALGSVRILCAHRRGPYGAATWMVQVEQWLAASVDGYGAGGRWYVGRPLMVTENDHALRLYNGDTGVVVAVGRDRVAAVFERRGSLVRVSPTRLATVETVHAMTVHKSQGSQYGHVAVVLPDPSSPILTRELLYTAVTRAQRRLTIIGPEASVRSAVSRPIARASGLRRRLWED